MAKRISRPMALIFTVFVLLSAVCNPTTYASSTDSTIKIGYIQNYGMGTQENSQMYGYTYDYLMEIAKYTGWSYEFIECTGSNYFEKLQSAEIDLVGPVQYNEVRSQVLDFSEQQMDYGFQYLVTHESRDFYYEDFNAFDGMRVGITHGDFYLDSMNRYCAQHQFDVTLMQVDGVNIEQRLENRDYDAIVITSLLYLPNVKIIGQLDTVPFYFASSKNNSQIMDQVDQAMDNLFHKNPFLTTQLHQKYYSNQTVAQPAYTKEEAGFIKSAGTYRVVADPDWEPFEHLNPATGKYEGINIEILDRISQVSGLDFEFITTNNYEDSLEMIHSGQADLLLGSTELAGGLDLSYTDSYMDVPMILAGLQAVDTTETRTVAMPGLSSQICAAAMQKYPHFDYKDYESTGKVVNALLKGKEDLAFLNLYTFNETVRKESTQSYFTIPLDVYLPLAIGVSNQVDPIVKGILNTAIGRIGTEEITSIIFADTAKNEYSVPLNVLLRENMILIISVLLAFFGLAIAFIVAGGRKRRKAIEKVAYIDGTTGLFTLAKFQIDAAEQLKNAVPNAYIIVSFDINHFKYINDTFGYQEGNQLLRAIGDKLLAFQDGSALFCRSSADNFLALMPNIPLEEIQNRFKSLKLVDVYLNTTLISDYSVHFSVGIFVVDDSAKNIFTLIDNANLARKTIKGRHGTCFAFYNSQMAEDSMFNKTITMGMEHALSANEFEPYLQPKFRLKTRELSGAEVLVRWRHPKKGLLMPDRFIPLFEENGFIQKLDFYMFEQACALIEKWKIQSIGQNVGPISVNLSRNCMDYPNLVENLIELAKKHHVSPTSIELEMTESIAMNNLSHLANVMGNIRAAGFGLSIDDFGSGYSSLNLLTKLPVDTIKIDRVFLSESYSSDRGKNIIHEIINLIRALDIDTLVEGVETEEQAQCLSDYGCDLAQGYLFSEPLSVPDFEKEYVLARSK